MAVDYLRKYGEATTIEFELFEADGVNFRTDAAHASGDTVIMKDEGAEANTANGFVDEGTGYSIALTAAEMQAARIVIYVVDQTATKVWLDRTLIIETYGHASAQHEFDLDTAMSSQTVLSAGSVTGSVGSLAGITFPTNFGDLSITVTTGRVTAASVEGNINGNVNGNVTGSVASVSGAVGSVSGSVASVTGNVAGNVSGDVGGKVLGGGSSSITGDGVQAASVSGGVGGSVASVTGDVGGKVIGGGASAFTGDGVQITSVSGSVGSVVGAVGSVTGSVGSVTGNVAGDVGGKVLGGGLSSITGDGVRAVSVTGSVGSVTGSVGSVTGSVGSIAGVTFPTNFDVLAITLAGGVSSDVVSFDGTSIVSNLPAAINYFFNVATPAKNMNEVGGGTPTIDYQLIRNAMAELAPTGSTNANSIDEKLDQLETQIGSLGNTITVVSINTISDSFAITCYEGQDLIVNITGLTNIDTYDDFVLTVKSDKDDDDSVAEIRVSWQGGLLVSNGTADGITAANSSLVKTSSTSLRWTLSRIESQKQDAEDGDLSLLWDLWGRSGSDVEAPLVVESEFTVIRGVNRDMPDPTTTTTT